MKRSFDYQSNELNSIKTIVIRPNDYRHEVVVNFNAPYIKIGKYIFKTMPFSNMWNLENNNDINKIIGLTNAQYQYIKDYIFDSKICIAAYNDSIKNINTIIFDVINIDHAIHVQLSHLIKLVKSSLKNQIINLDQISTVYLDGVDINLEIKYMDNKLNLQYNTLCGTITEDTIINFMTSNSSVNIYDQCIPINKDNVTIEVIDCIYFNNTGIMYENNTTRQQIIFYNKQLTNIINDCYSEEFSQDIQKFAFYENYILTFNIKINLEHGSGNYKNSYIFIDNNDFNNIVSFVDNVFVIKDNITANKIQFRLDKILTSKYLKSGHIIKESHLTKFINKNINIIREGETIIYHYKNICLNIIATNIYPKSEEINYFINENTEYEFTSEFGSNFYIVHNSKPIELETIIFEVKNSNNPFDIFSKNKKQTYQESFFKDLIKRYLPTKLVIGYSLNIINTLGDVDIHVKNMLFNPNEIITKSSYMTYGIITDKTIIKIITGDNNIIIASNQKSIIKSNPTLELEQYVGGLSDQINLVIRNICLSRGKMSKEFLNRGLKATRGIIFYGPPGTGKTSLARKIGNLLDCNESNHRLTMINGADIFDKYVGNSEKNVRNLFAPAKEAWKKYGENAPTYLLVIDEIDAMLPKRTNSSTNVRETVVNQFLGEMDGLVQFNNLIVIGSTNRLELLDPAVIRSGRFSSHIKFELPDVKGRLKIFNIYTKKLKEMNRLHDIDFNKLAGLTNNFSGADIEEVCNIASTLSLDRINNLNIDEITEKIIEYHGHVLETDFLTAIKELTLIKDKHVDKVPEHLYT